MSRRKQLKQMYKRMRPDMGIFMIRSRTTGKVYLEEAPDLKSAMNAGVFKLKSGMHRNRELQQDWNRLGERDFAVEVLDTLEYGPDESKSDYATELAELRAMWTDKLSDDGKEFYDG